MRSLLQLSDHNIGIPLWNLNERIEGHAGKTGKITFMLAYGIAGKLGGIKVWCFRQINSIPSGYIPP